MNHKKEQIELTNRQQMINFPKPLATFETYLQDVSDVCVANLDGNSKFVLSFCEYDQEYTLRLTSSVYCGEFGVCPSISVWSTLGNEKTVEEIVLESQRLETLLEERSSTIAKALVADGIISQKL